MTGYKEGMPPHRRIQYGPSVPQRIDGRNQKGVLYRVKGTTSQRALDLVEEHQRRFQDVLEDAIPVISLAAEVHQPTDINPHDSASKAINTVIKEKISFHSEALKQLEEDLQKLQNLSEDTIEEIIRGERVRFGKALDRIKILSLNYS